MKGNGQQPYTDMSISSGELYQAKMNSGIISTYGGCGPLALIGMFDCLSRYRGYENLLLDPTNENDRIQLATDVFSLTETTEIGLPNGNKNTYMSPSGFQQGAINVLVNAGYNDSFNLLSIKNHSQIKQSIDKGIPVSIWTGLLGGEGYLNLHWITLYGYEEWTVSDSQGNSENSTLYLIRSNYGENHDIYEYMDADLIDWVFDVWGAIIFEENFTEINILQSDYGFESQYFFYEIQKQIILSNGYSFNSTRLRTGYVYSYDSLGQQNGRYLVMSANRQNAGRAFLDYNFPTSVRGVIFDISLWSSSEGLPYQLSSIRLEMKVNGIWVNKKVFNILEISKDRTNRDVYLLYFNHPVSEIRFIVETAYPSGSSNKGRVVLGDLKILI